MYSATVNADMAEDIKRRAINAGVSTGEWIEAHWPMIPVAIIKTSRFNILDKDMSELDLFEWLMAHVVPNENLEPELVFDHKEIVWSR
jgi:hypothetical protein